MSIPPEILDLIADYWNGRGLSATCRRMWSRYSLDSFIICELVDAGRGIYVETSRLPDGTFHGACNVTASWSMAYRRDIVYYDRGAILRVDEIGDGIIARRDILKNGRRFIWNNGDVERASKHDGHYKIMANIDIADFERVVEEWLVDNDDVGGTMTRLPLLCDNTILPFTM